ncbi:MAG: alpha/beta hydrolase [Archangium gephyra]|uniref:Alpha/beta hydrolase n=1 Tax=Archangium gephyra TaxID=48 RepID=A0A2W5UQ95_9BACT|nr:MAG: alpha/beta hydrolase [Archangium gephyra]
MHGPFIKTEDGVELFHKDLGPKNAQPIFFHHGWPLSSDEWEAQFLFFLSHGFRVIAHDRRGHGRSEQVFDGHDMDHYAADVAAVVEHLDLKNTVHIGHSTGGGEALRYTVKHGKGRVAKLVLIGAITPLMLKTPANPEGVEKAVFDDFRNNVATNRQQFFLDVPSGPFYGFNKNHADKKDGLINNWWRQGMTGSAKAHFDCIKAFSETDFTEDLKACEVPTLVMHGDDDQVVPIAATALKAITLLKNGTLKVYEKLSHGMATTHPQMINEDLLAFVKGS